MNGAVQSRNDSVCRCTSTDCFVTTRPKCAGGNFIFHEECVGDPEVDAAHRVFDSLAGQIARNGDLGKHIVIKMDVEGAEWESLAKAPDEVLAVIDQLVVEFHGTGAKRFVETLARLKRMLVVAHVHFNNVTCDPGAAPFPARVYEVLFVNRALARYDDVEAVPRLPSLLDGPNNPKLPDCQANW